jgi:hypothetical protein
MTVSTTPTLALQQRRADLAIATSTTKTPMPIQKKKKKEKKKKKKKKGKKRKKKKKETSKINKLPSGGLGNVVADIGTNIAQTNHLLEALLPVRFKTQRY